MPFTRCIVAVLALTVWMVSPNAGAIEVKVAVAANFSSTAEQLAQRFSAKTGHRVIVISGATGKLYAQLSNGAPFDVFLSADEEYAARLVESGFAIKESRFTYAIGKLVLWSRTDASAKDATVLKKNAFKHLAIATPAIAPYGKAAKQVLERLKLWDVLQQKFVTGENIAQTYQFMATGNADVGFVALSQVQEGKAEPQSYWVIPQELYAPLRQDAVALKKSTSLDVANAFLGFLRAPEAKKLISSAGYTVP